VCSCRGAFQIVCCRDHGDTVGFGSQVSGPTPSGLVNPRARAYDPASGRFVSADSLLESQWDSDGARDPIGIALPV